MSDRRPFRKVSTLTAWLTAISVLAIGVAMLYVSGRSMTFWRSHQGLQSLSNNLGSTLIAAVALAGLWELVGKRAFARELFESSRTSISVQAAGLTNVSTDYIHEPVWARLIRSSSNIDVFVAYANTWRTTNYKELQEFLRRGGTLRVVLADPGDDHTMTVLARRFGDRPPADLRRGIETAAKEYAALAKAGGTVDVCYWKGDRVYSAYRLDGTIIATMYKHRDNPNPEVPVLTCERGGSLYEFFSAELDDIIHNTRSAT